MPPTDGYNPSMEPKRRTLWGTLSTLVALTLAASPAMAQDEQKLAITTIQAEGRRAERVAKQVRTEAVKASADWFEVVPIAEVNDAEETVSDMDDPDDKYARLGGATGANAVLTGAIVDEDGTWSVKLEVRSPRDGQVVTDATIELPRKRVDRRVKEEIGTEVPKLVVKYFSAEKARVEKEQADRKAAEEKAAAEKAAEEKAAADKAAAEQAEQERLEAERLAREEAERKKKESPPFRGSVGAGLTLNGRNLSFTVDSESAFEPYTYDGAMTPSARVAGELYPLGSTGKALGNLGLTFVFERTLALETEFGEGDAQQLFPTAQLHWGVGLKYQFPLGNSAVKDPSVMASIGFNGLSHTVDTENDMVLIPDVSYSYLDIGVGFRLPVTEQLAFSAMGKYLLVLSSGAISDEENYGDTSVLGLDFDANVEFLVIPMVKLIAGFQFTRMGLTFEDNGVLGAMGEVTGGSDTYLGGYLSAGYNF